MNSQTVLVTGAFGQVGKRCTEILLSRGRTVIAMDVPATVLRPPPRTWPQRRITGKLIPEYTDLTDTDAVAAVVERHRPDAIVHLAAIVSPPSYRNPRLARKVNVDGTRHLVEAARALSDPPLFVFASSAAVYGSRNPNRQPERITGDTPVNPIDQYGEDKVIAEAVITKSGLPHAILRLGGVFSPDGRPTSTATICSWCAPPRRTTACTRSMPEMSRWPSPTPWTAATPSTARYW